MYIYIHSVSWSNIERTNKPTNQQQKINCSQKKKRRKQKWLYFYLILFYFKYFYNRSQHYLIMIMINNHNNSNSNSNKIPRQIVNSLQVTWGEHFHQSHFKVSLLLLCLVQSLFRSVEKFNFCMCTSKSLQKHYSKANWLQYLRKIAKQ